jgi:hypothetical protein
MIITAHVDQAVVDGRPLSAPNSNESIVSSTNSTLPGCLELPFVVAKSFRINTRGISLLQPSHPPSELQTTVHNLDGSLAYKSTRTKRGSGNCMLTNASGKALVSTTYHRGPSKGAVLSYVDAVQDVTQDIKTASEWRSRNHTFRFHDGRTFAWRYKKDIGLGAKGTTLTLELGGETIAALFRNDHTRTPGSKSCSAGNGGELVMGTRANETRGLSEELIIATCLVMLKKEIDRMRTVQSMVIASAIC